MLPPGRRRATAQSPMSICFALLVLFTATASAAGSVLGLDFGTLNIKAVLVKPGIPLEIVLTKDSKRKESAAVAFKPTRDSKNNIIAELGTFPERAYGSDALALQGRMPGEVFPNLKPLLGLPSNDAESTILQSYKARYPAVQVTQVPEMGTTMFKSGAFVNEEFPWSVEELLAMELATIKQNAERMAGKGSVVEDVVITIPPFYTADEKRSIERAARLAGLDVNSLISDGLAVGLDYAKSRTFPEVTKGEKPEHHIVFDMGAGSTTATLMRFQGKSVKDVGRFNKTVQEVAVLGTGWDRTLGGDSLTSLILTDYVRKFMTKPVMKSRGTEIEEIQNNGRVMSRLWKEAEKSRQVLSANTETTSSFEELLPEIDFRVKLTRTEFEKITSEYADRVAGPINDALAAAKMTVDDIDSIILYGGAVRTPFVQKQLEKIAGGSAKLRTNVNADESAVFGAALKGASLSPSFKVKEIRDSDVSGYAAGMLYTDGGKERKQTLFSTTSPVGNGATTKQITFKDKEDFTFGLYQQVGDVERPITTIKTENLTASVKTLKDKFGCEKDDISTKFSVKLNPLNGLPEVVGGTVSCEVEGSGKGESIGDSVKGWLGLGKKDQEPLVDGAEDSGPTEGVEAAASTGSAESESASTASTSESSSVSKEPDKPKKRTESISIKIGLITQGNPQPAQEETKRMRDRLTAFDQADQARFAREESLNVLEGYTYYVRDLLTNPDFQVVSTKKQREEISKLLADVRDFMENPKEISKASKETFTDRNKQLEALVNPIQKRRQEEVARPEKVKLLRTSLEQMQKLIDMVRTEVLKARDAQQKAEEYDASQSAENAASATDGAQDPAASNDLDDLEEPDSGANARGTDTDVMGPKYTNAADFTQYTNLDVTELENAYESASKWLAEKEAGQSKLNPYDEPVLLTKDIEQKADELGEIMKDLLYKKMKAEKPSSKSKAKSTKSSKTKSSKKGKKTGSSSVDEEATASGEQPSFITVNPGEDMPSEEEILEMISNAKGKSSSSEHVVDEL